jgi:uncharacterized protein (DUF983 family)
MAKSKSWYAYKCKQCGHDTHVGFSTRSPKCGVCGKRLSVWTRDDIKKLLSPSGKLKKRRS